MMESTGIIQANKKWWLEYISTWNDPSVWLKIWYFESWGEIFWNNIYVNTIRGSWTELTLQDIDLVSIVWKVGFTESSRV